MAEAHQHHLAEQQWATASHHLDSTLDNVRGYIDVVAAMAETRDPSALFDWAYSVMVSKNRLEPGSFEVCEMICAAALVRLALTPKTEDPLEQLLLDENTENTERES